MNKFFKFITLVGCLLFCVSASPVSAEYHTLTDLEMKYSSSGKLTFEYKDETLDVNYRFFTEVEEYTPAFLKRSVVRATGQKFSPRKAANGELPSTGLGP